MKWFGTIIILGTSCLAQDQSSTVAPIDLFKSAINSVNNAIDNNLPAEEFPDISNSIPDLPGIF